MITCGAYRFTGRMTFLDGIAIVPGETYMIEFVGYVGCNTFAIDIIQTSGHRKARCWYMGEDAFNMNWEKEEN